VKAIIGFVLCLAIGVAAVVSGIEDATADEPTCNGHVQARDEICAHHSTTRRTTYTDYGATAARTGIEAAIKIGLGGFLLLIPTAVAVGAVCRRRPAPPRGRA
jgi:hypothetical protein